MALFREFAIARAADLARSPQQNSQINSATFFGFFVAVMCHQRIGRPPCLTQFSCHAIP